MRATRPLTEIYLSDEGEHAIRWLIGQINYGPYQETRDTLRTAPLDEVQRWAASTGNLQLAELADHVVNDLKVRVQMNEAIRPDDRLPAVAAAVLFSGLGQSVKVSCLRADEHCAVFTVDNQVRRAQVEVTPHTTVATADRNPCRRILWDTRLGAEAFTTNLANLLE